jgi:predicted histone-like DNA-binding protein
MKGDFYMPVYYRLYKSKRADANIGKWMGRAVNTGVVATNDLAEIIQRNCTVKRSDVLAVLAELVEVMSDQLQNSKRVKLDNFGSFKLGIHSKPADTAADYNARKHVSGVHVLFMPETKVDTTGKRQKTFLNGVEVAELPKNAVDTSKKAADTTPTTPTTPTTKP